MLQSLGGFSQATSLAICVWVDKSTRAYLLARFSFGPGFIIFFPNDVGCFDDLPGDFHAQAALVGIDAIDPIAAPDRRYRGLKLAIPHLL